MDGWALDLGTTNTGLAFWDAEATGARLLEISTICRKPGHTDPLEAPRLIPSAVQMLPARGLADRLGRMSLFMKMTFWGRQAVIGRPALEQNSGGAHPAFAPSFKGYLGRAPHRTIAQLRGEAVSARVVARTFLRELLREVKAQTGERIRECVVTVPVESYDQYRAELTQIGDALGIKRMRFIDEPVAAAIGYGLGLRGTRKVLVVDFGGGTLDLAVVDLTPRTTEIGACNVIAKAGRPIGGNVVDGWLLSAFAEKMQITINEDADSEESLWNLLMLAEARRVKEAIHFSENATFSLSPPAEMRSVAHRIGRDACYCDITRDQVIEILEGKGLYAILEDCADEIERQLIDRGVSEDQIEDVLMVGGSTLLPQVYPTFEKRYGRNRVRAWQPFEAVAYGAAGFSAGRYGQSDFVVHDYAIVTYDAKTNEKEYIPVIEQNTRFPTQPDHWKRTLVPTCALGEPERIFKLVICEISGRGSQRQFTWDLDGKLHRADGEGKNEPIVVPLNESNPALGVLDPPHQPGDRTARLEVAFGVNADRWLIATVKDLRTGKRLMDGEPVIRLL